MPLNSSTMLTKEDILKSKDSDTDLWLSSALILGRTVIVYEAMEQYAKQEAKAFFSYFMCGKINEKDTTGFNVLYENFKKLRDAGN